MGRREAIGIREEIDKLPVVLTKDTSRLISKVPQSTSINGNSDHLDHPDDQASVAAVEVPPIPVVFFASSSSPSIESVGTHSATVTWQPFQLASIDPQPAEDLVPDYTLTYSLEFLEVVTGSAAKKATPKHETSWTVAYNGANTSFQVDTLRPGRSYAFRVRCTPLVTKPECELAPVEPSPSAEVNTTPTPPIAPSPPALSSKTRNSLKVKWNIPEETGGLAIICYRLQMCSLGPSSEPVEQQGGSFSEVFCGEERNFKVTGLRPGMRYAFCVMATNAMGHSPYSSYSYLTTQASVPSVITSQQQVSRSATSVGFRWSPPDDNGAPISGYVMERDDGQGGDFHITYSGMQPACMITDLKSGLPYRFRLRADNSEGRGNWTPPFTATTAALPPPSPRPPTTIGTNRTSATVSWVAPDEDGGSPVTGYQVEIQPKTRIAMEQLGNDWLLVYDGPATAHTVATLQAGCSYMCRVRAVNAVGPGQWSAATELQSAADVPYPPSAPSAANTSTHSLLVQWSPPPHDGGCKVSCYRLEMHPLALQDSAGPSTSYANSAPSQRERVYSCVYSGEECSAEVSGLSPGCDYIFRATALNSQGGSDYSPSTVITTAPAVPLAPPPPVGTSSTGSSLGAQWGVPDGQGAPVTGFVVEMAKVEEGAEWVEKEWTEGSCKWQFNTVYRGAESKCEIKGLEPHSRYLLRVRAVNSVGAGAWSSPPSLHRTQAAAPSAPLGLTAEGLSSSSILLNWLPPTSTHGAPLTSYILESAPARSHAKPPSSTHWSQVWQGTETSCQIPNLPPGRAYTFRVKAVNARGTGTPSAPATAATLPSPPSAPDKVTVSQRTANSMRLKWSLPHEDNGAPVEFFVLEMAGVDGEYRKLYQGHELMYRISGLQAVSEYSFRVAAVNISGRGPCSAPVTVQTMMLPPQPPQDVDVAVEMEGQGEEDGEGDSGNGEGAVLLVSWDAPVVVPQCAGVLLYEVEAASESEWGAGEPQTCKQTVSGKLGECRLKGLPTGTAFNVRMRAVGVEGTGHSQWTPNVRVITPGPKRVLTEVQTNGGELVVNGAAAIRKRSKGKGKGKARALEDSDNTNNSGTPRAGAGKVAKGKVATTAVAKGPPKKLILGFIHPKVLKMIRRFLKWVLLAPLLLFLVKLIVEETSSRMQQRRSI